MQPQNRINFHASSPSTVVFQYSPARGSSVQERSADKPAIAVARTCGYEQTDAEFKQIMANLDALLEIARSRLSKSSAAMPPAQAPVAEWTY